jgi:hypothetical protein
MTKPLGPVGKLLSDESKWTKGAYARDKDGVEGTKSFKAAVCWCLSGAIIHCYRLDASRFLGVIQRRLNVAFIADWNDAPERTFAEVRALVEELGI